MEPEPFSLLHALDSVTSHHDVGAFGCDLGKPLVGKSPVRAVIEVQQGDVHAMTLNVVPCYKVKVEVDEMLIGELADAAGVTSQTVRFYERKGLLSRPERGANGYRIYDQSVLARLRFINVAQAAGLTLSEIRSIIDLRNGGTVPCAHVATLIDSKLADVQARITRLASLEAELKALLVRSHKLDPADCADDDICHIISSAK